MTRADRSIIGTFAALQSVWVLSQLTGPFADEGIYAAAGLAISRDSGFDFSWLGGSPYLFPIVSGHAFKFLGLVGCRLVAVASCSFALLYFQRFAASLVGSKAATWGLLSLCLNGIFFSFAHLGVYDCFAFMAFCLAAGAGSSQDWSVGTAALVATFATFGVLSKYTSAVPFGALAAVLLLRSVASNRRLIVLSVALCACLSALAFRLTSDSWFPESAISSFGDQKVYDRVSVLTDWIYFAGLPTGLAFCALALAQKSQRFFYLAVLGAAGLWPMLHIVAGSRVSLNKHVIFSLIFLSPLVGLLFQRAWERSKNVVASLVLSSLTVGLPQAHVQDRLWIDARPAAHFFQTYLQPGQTIGFEWGWALAPYLYGPGIVDSLSNILDLTELRKRGKKDLCKLDYIVSYEGSGMGSRYLVRAAKRCSFAVVYEYPTEFWALTGLFPLSYRGRVVISQGTSDGVDHYVER